MRKITCKKCGFTAPEVFFTSYGLKKTLSRVKASKSSRICLMCRQEEQDKNKRGDRTVPKAKNIIYTHCQRYNRRHGTNLKPTEFARMFGWDQKRIAHDIEHAFGNWCSYCESPYSKMEHGLADVTLDIVSPNEPPYYSTNTRLCCATCNKRKGQMGAEEFGQFLALVKQRREYLESHFGTELKPQYAFHFNGREGGENG